MFDMIGFGESMLRLTPFRFERIEQARAFDVSIGGAELNVAACLSRLGLKTSYVTRLARNPIGRLIEARAHEIGVDTSHVIWSNEDRQGVYYLEFGALPRANAIIYDRKGTAVSKIQPGMLDWDKILSQTKALHVTGITPALSSSAAEVTTEALKKAKEKKVQVSFDLNYRVQLWTQEEAKKTLSSLMPYVDILITTEEDTERVFQIKGKDWEDVAGKLVDAFGFRIVAITLRENVTVWRNNWTAIALKDGKIYKDRKYEIEVVDRVGSGDAFAGGFLYGYLTRGDVQEALKYGNATAVLKHSNPTDFGWFTLEEVEKLIVGGGDLRINR
ncbi:PfkB family carbohydrate kinase [Chloroflexota bacterium]